MMMTTTKRKLKMKIKKLQAMLKRRRKRAKKTLWKKKVTSLSALEEKGKQRSKNKFQRHHKKQK